MLGTVGSGRFKLGTKTYKKQKHFFSVFVTHAILTCSV